jgi:signal transduction histidine kinase
MNNVAKHSGATHVHLLLTARDNRIELTVADNGCGFDPDEKKSSEPSVAGGFGLSGMMDRTQLCDGKFEIFSEKGNGTTVQISLPCGSESIGSSNPDDPPKSTSVSRRSW